MERCEDLMTSEKQIIVTHLKSGMSTLQISKMIKRDHRTVQKASDNIVYKGKPNKGKGFKDISGSRRTTIKENYGKSSVTDE